MKYFKIKCQGLRYFHKSSKMRFNLKEWKISGGVSSDVF